MQTIKARTTTADTDADIIPRNLPGLGKGEKVIKVIKFDGSEWYLVRYQDALYTTYRMVQAIIKDGEINNCAMLVDGELRCQEIRAHYAVNRLTRRIGTEQASVSYKFRYIDNLGTHYETVYNNTELNLDARPRWDFLSRLNLDMMVKPNKYPRLAVLLKAIAFDARNNKSTPIVRVIGQTGIVYIDEVMHYANATGKVIGPNGKIRNDIICEPDTVDQYELIEFRPVNGAEKTATEDEIPGMSMAEKQSGLRALIDIMNGNTDLGVTGLMTGQLIGALISGTKLRDQSSANSLSVLNGPTSSGKTAYATALFTSQTRTLSGEITPSMICRITPNKGSGGATAIGIFHKLKSYSSGFAVYDDVIKAMWEQSDKRRAHDIIMEKVTGFTIGGTTPQAQSTPSAGVTAAPPIHLTLSGIFTVEDLGAKGALIHDSTYNRLAVIWWNKEERAPRDTFMSLINKENTLRRNDGLSVILNMLLNSPEILSDGYDKATQYLQQYLSDPRTVKAYARCLAGLHALDIACETLGMTNPYSLDVVMPHAVKQALMLETGGTYGGDEKAVFDPVEATREANRVLTRIKHGIYFTQPIDKEDVGKGIIPQPPEQLPEGQDPSFAGWFPNGADAPWMYLQSGLNAGIIKPKRTGGRDSSPWEWRMECTPSEWAAYDNKLAEVSKIARQYVPTRQERIDALETAGVFRKVKSHGVIKYQVDWEWLTGQSEPITAEIVDESDDDQ